MNTYSIDEIDGRVTTFPVGSPDEFPIERSPADGYAGLILRLYRETPFTPKVKSAENKKW
jgi:hypothetical protein